MTVKGIRVEVVNAELGETAGHTTARHELRPTVQAVRTVQTANPTASGVPVGDLVAVLNDQVRAVKSGDLSRQEEILVAQAYTLDQLFHRLAKQAMSTEYLDPFQAAMRLALKAQAQCARTIEVLNEMKNPRPVSYVAQANVGQNVQVNNGVSTPVRACARAGGKEQRAPTELLEASDGERLDAGTAGAAVGSDQALAAVDAQHRT